MDAAGSSRAALFGWIDGAPLSALFAATYRARVSALVLLGSFSRRIWAPNYPWGLTDEQFRAANDVFMRVFYGSQAEGIEALRLITGEGPDDDELRRDVEFVRRACGSPNAWRAYLDLYRDFDVRHVLPAIRVPTLLIHGAEAGLIMPIEGARHMAQQITGAKLLELPGESQVPWGPGLDQTLDATEEFLRDVWVSGAWDEPESDRVLATVLFTDIVGSSERAAELGDRAWRELLQRHHELVRFVLVKGSADVRKDKRHIATLKAGDFAGEIALLSDAPRTATVTATSPITALRATRKGFSELLKTSPSIQQKVLTALAERVASTSV